MKLENSINVLVGGDFFPGKETEKIAIDNPISLWGDSIELFKASDLSIVNLEAPLTSAMDPIIKTGPNMKLSQDCISALTCTKIDVVALANNHIRDYGDQGIKDTLVTCQKNGIDIVGAGKDVFTASETLYKQVKGTTIAIVNFAENEWSSATDSQYGANPMDIIDNAKQIQEARGKANIVLVIIHGGHEYYKYPSPRMVKQYRFYAEQGATMVIGHHSHCISGYEIHHDVPIIYSLGNLFFPSETKFEGWYEGMLLSIDIQDDLSLDWSLIPYEQNKNGAFISLLKKEENKAFQKKVIEINKVITDPDSLKRVWDTYRSKQTVNLLSFLIPVPLIGKIIRRLGIRMPSLFIKHFALILNIFRCEAHRDLMISTLDDFVNNNDRKR